MSILISPDDRDVLIEALQPVEDLSSELAGWLSALLAGGDAERLLPEIEQTARQVREYLLPFTGPDAWLDSVEDLATVWEMVEKSRYQAEHLAAVGRVCRRYRSAALTAV